MKVLVTGSNGTLGRAFVEHLKGRGIAFCRYDREHPEETERDFDCVVNFAGITVHSSALTHKRVSLFRKVNVRGTRKILSFLAKNKKLKRFVHIGTSAEYGSRNTKLTEKSSSRPGNEYGVTKLEQSKLIEEFFRAHDVKVINLRVFNILGVTRHPNQKKQFIDEYILSRLIGGADTTEVSNTNDVRDYISMNDAFSAIFAALITEKGSKYELINICSGRGTTISGLVRLFEKETGRTTSLVSVNKSRTKYVGSCVKAKRILGWKPMQTLTDIVHAVTIEKSKAYY
jgi:UDP-glucose 4-epimerase